MQRSMLNWLACAGLAVALCLGSGSWGAAYAGDDDDKGKPELSITEVLVSFEDIDYDLNDIIRITVQGVDLDTAQAVKVSLGEQGMLEVLSAGGNQIVALCPGPDFICVDGDFLLTVSVKPGHWTRHDDDSGDEDWARFDDDEDDGHDSRRPLIAAYDLTIGAVGPKGDKGDRGEPGPAGSSGISGYEIVVGSTALNTNPYKQLSVSCPSGKSVLGGGAGIFWTGAVPLPQAPRLISSFMYPTNNSWYGEGQSPSTYTGSWRLEVQVICAAVSS